MINRQDILRFSISFNHRLTLLRLTGMRGSLQISAPIALISITVATPTTATYHQSLNNVRLLTQRRAVESLFSVEKGHE